MLKPDMLRRRDWLMVAGSAAAASITPAVWAAGAVLPAPESLADELAKALRAGQPLVVMVSLEGCPFCRIARDNYLDPARRQDGIPIFQIDMRSPVPVRDFNRAAATQDQLIRDWKVKVAPTVLFFGPGGKEVAERMVGGYIEDFYAAYLEQRLKTSRAAIKA